MAFDLAFPTSLSTLRSVSSKASSPRDRTLETCVPNDRWIPVGRAHTAAIPGQSGTHKLGRARATNIAFPSSRCPRNSAPPNCINNTCSRRRTRTPIGNKTCVFSHQESHSICSCTTQHSMLRGTRIAQESASNCNRKRRCDQDHGKVIPTRKYAPLHWMHMRTPRLSETQSGFKAPQSAHSGLACDVTIKNITRNTTRNDQEGARVDNREEEER